MSKGAMTDLADTLAVIEKRRSPEYDGKTWLRHGVSSEAGRIDLALLDGASKSELSALCRNGWTRAHTHLEHLQGRHGPEPHSLRLVERGDRWFFDVDWLRAWLDSHK